MKKENTSIVTDTVTTENLIEELTKLFPSKTYEKVSDIVKLNQQLYTYLNTRAKEKNFNTEGYLEILGFKKLTNSKYTDTVEDEKLIEELTKLFPSKTYEKVIDIFNLKQPLYHCLNRMAKNKKIKTDRYLEELGFKKLTNSKYNDTVEDEKLIEDLTRLFPSKTYEKVSDISKLNQQLYVCLNSRAKDKNFNTEGYLEMLGFKNLTNSQRIIYDISSLYKLVTEYNINEATIAKVMNCSRENIRQKLKYNINKNKNKWIIPLNQKEIDEINEFVRKRKTFFFSEDKSFVIIDNKTNTTEKAIVYRDANIVKCSFDIPVEIKDIVNDINLDIFSPEELDFQDKLKKLWLKQGKRENNNKKMIFLSQNEKAKVKSFANKNGLEFKEYLDFFDFICEDKRYLNEDEVLLKILKYSDHNKKITLHSDDEDYYFFTSRAARSKINIYQFFKKYGYIYSRERNVAYVLDKHKEDIKSKYIVEGNNIYIPSYDPFYGTLNALANNKGISLNKLIEDLGFTRISNKRNLPLNYKPYDYKTKLEKSGIIDENKIMSSLTMISNDNGEVYIDVSSYLYYTLFLRAKVENTSIADMLYKYGYKRIYKTELNNEINTNLEEVEYLLEEHKKDFIIETLEKLKLIQSKYKLVKNSEQKIVRNKKLVAILKDLYQCRCQICNPDVIQIPAIYNEKDELYAEVHHITSIAQAKEFNDDIEFIDSYANTMVLCPYHHKFVHIQNGGYTKLVKDENDVLFLENKYGERIQIYIDYHLDV